MNMKYSDVNSKYIFLLRHDIKVHILNIDISRHYFSMKKEQKQKKPYIVLQMNILFYIKNSYVNSRILDILINFFRKFFGKMRKILKLKLNNLARAS